MAWRPTRRRMLLAGAALAGMPGALAAAPARPLHIGAVLPIAGTALPPGRINLRPVAEAARMGLILAEEDMTRNGTLLGLPLALTVTNAPGADAVARAARRLVSRSGATVLIGGFTRDEAEILSQVADETGALFLNIAAPSDALRHACRPGTFHVEASAAMYLDELLGWFVRAGHRRWFLVHDDGAEGRAMLDRMTASLTARHWGAEVAGTAALRVDDARGFAPALSAIAGSDADVVLLLTDWWTQLEFLSRYEASGLPAPVTGFPEPATQTRDFYFAARRAAPVAGCGHRAVLWEATLDAYGARELNARFDGRWGRPMDPTAWAAYQAVKIAFEASLATGATQGAVLAGHLAGDRGLFDVSKGIGVTFRPWDHQLRQSLFLARINPDATGSMALGDMLARASLVGELPAIYMPGTDPVERLDQLGDIDPARTCTRNLP
ncbi:hypothetical protein EYF88_16380 [Paracoccus sediminis]|uniref:ABC-type branched-chain amino acid transport system, substrate-binding protein n=1 Tax=Paracoccus sediminis TaxID=1214787 RepID=A0A238YFG2_9RHOB|nr:ABC transporter substrate-binding protein [Paracoccus sediminis]TBN46637.1 hypothetical protein EYF88_16380 [Paracoccus sediminis]SNR70006.1 ABC-type branched-chain amino acid transport system, substrate-binding protein [Paracoccus sediminis]